MFNKMTVRITQTASRLCLAVTKASGDISVNVISRVTFSEYEIKKTEKEKYHFMMRNMINLDMHSMKRFLVRTDDEKKINVSMIITFCCSNRLQCMSDDRFLCVYVSD